MSAPWVRWEALVVQVGTFRLGPLSGHVGPGVWRVVGPNGAGKTTFLRLLCGALAPTSGRVWLPGGEPHREPAARGEAAWLPAAAELPDLLTAGEAWRMLAGLRGAAGGAGDERLRALGLAPEQRLGALSLGQRKKAELVAALAGEPAVLLLDEAFAPLDAAARQVVGGWLAGWRTRRVILLAEHGDLPLAVDGEVALAGG